MLLELRKVGYSEWSAVRMGQENVFGVGKFYAFLFNLASTALRLCAYPVSTITYPPEQGYT